ncbi:adenylate kinase [Candidatus Micrarchaeota archaeon]|nr:adenylate kinase [Candidatus Micrarchaeota archaeon]
MIIVTGTPGSGKTTLINSFKDKYTILNYGTIMFEIAMEEGIVDDRDELRKIPFKKQLELQKKAAKKIALVGKTSNVILDTHASISTPTGYYPGLSKEALQILNPDTIVFVYVPFEELVERIQEDNSRKRDEFINKQKVDELIEISKLFIATYAAECSAKIALINNSGPVGSAVPEMKKILE